METISYSPMMVEFVVAPAPLYGIANMEHALADHFNWDIVINITNVNPTTDHDTNYWVSRIIMKNIIDYLISSPMPGKIIVVGSKTSPLGALLDKTRLTMTWVDNVDAVPQLATLAKC